MALTQYKLHVTSIIESVHYERMRRWSDVCSQILDERESLPLHHWNNYYEYIDLCLLNKNFRDTHLWWHTAQIKRVSQCTLGYSDHNSHSGLWWHVSENTYRSFLCNHSLLYRFHIDLIICRINNKLAKFFLQWRKLFYPLKEAWIPIRNQR